MPIEQRIPALTMKTGLTRDEVTASDGYLHHKKVRALQRSLYLAAKSDRRRSFHQLLSHVYRLETLTDAWLQVKKNGGVSGVDGVEIAHFEQGVAERLALLADALKTGAYRPHPVKRVYIPKGPNEQRPLGIPCVVDRVVQTAITLVLEPIMEARFYEHSYGFRPGRSAHQALDRIERLVQSGYTYVLDLDVRQFFDSVPHEKLLDCLSRHTSDRKLIKLVKSIIGSVVQEPSGMFLRCTVGCPQGGPLSPLLANLYLSILDFWCLKNIRYKDAVWIRYADDAVLISKTPVDTQRKRIESVLRRMQLQIHPDKTRHIDLGKCGEHLDFLGYRMAKRKSRSTSGLVLLRYPSPKAQVKIRARLRQVISPRSQVHPQEMSKMVSSIVRGWVGYFSRSHCRKPFHSLADFVRLRMCIYMTRRRGRRGLGKMAYPGRWMTDVLGVANAYLLFAEVCTRRAHAAR